MKKVALISTYCDTQEKIDVLEKNIKNCRTCGLDVMVISPFYLPENIQKQCDYFFLTKDNPVLDWPERAMFAWYEMKLDGKPIVITRTYPDYGWAGLCQVKKLSEIALSLNYDYFYHIIYDLKFDEAVVEGLLSERECDIYPSKRGEVNWEVGLHFMIFNRENLQKFISHILLESYLSIHGGHAFIWLAELRKKFPYNVPAKPVEDEIYYYEGQDFFNASPFNGLKFFIEKNDQKNTTVKLLFYDIKEPKIIILTIGENKYQYEIKGNALIDLGVDKKNIPFVSIWYDGEEKEITEKLKKIKHNTIEVSE